MPDVSAFCPACGRSTVVETLRPAANEKVLGAVSYVLLLPAVIFLVVPPLRSRRFLCFHSWQSIFFFIATLVLGGIFRLVFLTFSIFPFVGFLIAWLVLTIGSLGIFTLWVVLVVKAAQGEKFELPLIGPWAAQLAF